jgi:hypothetical protein
MDKVELVTNPLRSEVTQSKRLAPMLNEIAHSVQSATRATRQVTHATPQRRAVSKRGS